MELGKGAVDQRRKRILQFVFMGFMGLLLLFTLFSNTLQSLTLPKVTTEQPKNGGIALSIEGSGMLQPIAEAKLSSSTDWEVQQVLVKEGERVKKGQKLITYDNSSARQEIELEVTNLEKQRIEQQNLQDQFIQSSIEEDELKLRSAKREIEKGKLDIAAQERKINEMKVRLSKDQVLTAPFDGIVTKLNAVEGLASGGEPDVIVSNSSQGYRLEVGADAKRLSSIGISIGERIEVEVHTDKVQQAIIMDGVIEEMSHAEPLIEGASEGAETITVPQKMIRIKLLDAKLKGGEQARINIEKSSLDQGLLVSNEAIHQDREGMYVFVVEEQPGALGNVFVARKVNITYSERNDKETMIQTDSIYEQDKIILKSSEPLQDGNRVRLE
ncbi:biotin/lipoyl-binding protein [Virgibacillus sp. LDC1]|uniref:efflux RND transporter periplasmic adaptor subunit n=1 Tax=Paenibacillus lautus TaxID=1401 RepID=UPI002DB9A5AC|nr:biotin/lipoyl-binding protein [Paenibacillus lautus]MCV4231488.1 biotin/lipoyl-binding protein [Virgibacillus sp. LDC1]MEC0256586.1 HlyD family efflux transporter periplasmic adaptor subunit [Paenibacillus lautus]